MAAFLALGCASVIAVSAAETFETDFISQIESVTFTEEDNPAAGDIISLELNLRNVTDDDDLGSLLYEFDYDNTKLRYVESRSKTGTGKKAVSHMADYFGSIFQTGMPGACPARTVVVDVSFENQLWDTDWDINNDIFFMIDFEVLGDWGGSTEIVLSGQGQHRGTSLYYSGMQFVNGTVTRPGSDEPEVTPTLTVAAEGTGTVDATVNDTATTGITTATEFAPESGSTVTLEAKGEGFRYWKNALSGAIVSEAATLTWTDIGSVRSLVAVFADETVETFDVIYKDFRTGKIYKVDSVASGTVLSAADMPTATTIFGYTFDAWKAAVAGGKAPAAIGTEVTSDLVVYPTFTKSSTGYTLNVDNGNHTDHTYTRSYASLATVCATKEGFSYWVDEEGTILSLDATFTFSMPARDVTLTAVFDAPAVPEAVLTILDNTLYEGSITTLFARDLAEGCTLVESGILYTRKAAVSALVVPVADQTVTQGISSDSVNSSYGFVKDVAGKTGTWLIRGYMIYTDSTGNLLTVYTDVQSVVVA